LLLASAGMAYRCGIQQAWKSAASVMKASESVSEASAKQAAPERSRPAERRDTAEVLPLIGREIVR